MKELVLFLIWIRVLKLMILLHLHIYCCVCILFVSGELCEFMEQQCLSQVPRDLPLPVEMSIEDTANCHSLEPNCQQIALCDSRIEESSNLDNMSAEDIVTYFSSESHCPPMCSDDALPHADPSTYKKVLS